MKYASVCSGVEAASLAWMPLGWEAAWFSEIEPFPCAVLKERFPNVPNLGDMTKIEGEKYRGTIDLLVGGTPCQGFSAAGKGGGLDDPRSALCLAYCRLLKTMRPRWFVWENVPGVFSTNGGEDFRVFLRKIDEIGYSCAWRVLDAQYVRVDGFPRAVPQRRRRVFVVGHIGDWRYPASVLFEPGCLPGNTPPRRKTRKELAGDAGKSIEDASGEFQIANGSGKRSDVSCTLDVKCKDGAIRKQAGMAVVESGKGYYSESESAQTLEAHEDQHRRNIICMAHGQSNAERLEDCGVNLTCNHEAPIVAGFMGGQGAKAGGIAYSEGVSPTVKAGQSGTNTIPDVVCMNPADSQTSRIYDPKAAYPSLNANSGGGMSREGIICVHGTQDPINNSEVANAVNRNHGAENCVCQYGSVAGTLEARHDSSPCADRGMNVIAFCKTARPHFMGDSETYKNTGCSPTINTFDVGEKRANELVVCYENHMQDSRVKECGECAPQLNAKAGTGGNNLPLVQAIAIAENTIGRKVENGGNGLGAQEELAYTQNATGVMGVSVNATVRRLLPIECERLMGFPDNHTRIPWRGKPEEQCPDGPRYKACGNSMCVNVMRWIGMRIELVERKGTSC